MSAAPRLSALALALAAPAALSLAVAQDEPRPEAPASRPTPRWDERLRPTDLETLRAAAFDPTRLKARRQALLARLPKGALVVAAAPPAQREFDRHRQDPDFLYLSGLRDPGLSFLLSAEEEVLFAPPHSAHHEQWNGPRVAVGTPQARASGFQEVAVGWSRGERLEKAIARGGPLFLLNLELKDLGLKKPPAQALPLAHHLHRLRLVKDLHEVALLQRAIDITSASLREALASLAPEQHEYEAQAVIEYLFLRYGAQRPGFPSIVGSGPNSCVLHYQQNRRRMAAGDLVVMDVGAELWGYTADVTRTAPVSGRFSRRQREVYEIVLAAQAAGFKAVRPGATMAEVHAAAAAVIRRAGYGKHFTHGTSHWLGMDVHDVGPTLASLEPGMVLTVEPGIYIADEQLGVRIEDDVVVTETGCRVLSEGVPRTVEAIEALMTRRGVGAQPVAPLPQRAAPRRHPRPIYYLPR